MTSPVGVGARVGRALGLALPLLLLGLAVAPAGAADAGDAGQLPGDGDLALAETAGAVIVGLTLRPAEGGEAELWLHLEPSHPAPDAAALDPVLTVDGALVALERCGEACRRAAASVRGGEEVAVEISGEGGGSAELTLPSTLPPSSGEDLLDAATERMNALERYRVIEHMGPDEAATRAVQHIDAPDRFRLDTDGGHTTVRVGERIFTKREGERFWRSRQGPPIDLPSHIWDLDAPPRAVWEVGTATVDGVAVTEVAFFIDEDGRPIWYRLAVDDGDLVRAADMLTGGHVMRHRYEAFDEPVAIEPPRGPVATFATDVVGDPPAGLWRAGASAIEVLAHVGVLAAAGGVLFLARVHDRRGAERVPLARLVTAAALLAVAATAVAWPLRVGALDGTPGLADPAVWGDALGLPRALELGLRLLGGLAVVAALPGMWRPRATAVATAGALLAVASLLPVGHGATADLASAALSLEYAHLLAAAGWFGGLLLLGATVRLRAADAPPADVLASFSRLAAVCLAVVTLAGVGVSALHLGGPGGLVDGAYGAVLLVKVAVVAAVALLGAHVRYRVVPACRTGAADAWPRLRRSVRLEAAGLAAVVAVTAVLVNLPAPS